jgi:uncharacterized membrane protein SirB2
VTLFDGLKLLHVSCAFISISGFALRGYWMIRDNPLRQRPLARVAPHVIDTLLLASAIGMLLVWRVSPLGLDWLTAKISALVIYIGLGMVAFRFAKERQIKLAAYFGALVSAAYILTVAYTKSPAGPLWMLSG